MSRDDPLRRINLPAECRTCLENFAGLAGGRPQLLAALKQSSPQLSAMVQQLMDGGELAMVLLPLGGGPGDDDDDDDDEEEEEEEGEELDMQ